MITRFDSSPDRILIESRRAGGRRLFLSAVVACVFMSVLVALELAALEWVLEGEFALTLPLVVLPVLFLLAPVFVGPWALLGWERIELHGLLLRYESWIGGHRTRCVEYELLKMKGLHPVNSPLSRPGIQFWYRDGARFFGDTLETDEKARVAEALLEYDSRVRSSLGMDPAQGLAWDGVWHSPEARQAELEYIYSQQRFDAHPFVEPGDRADCQ